jgi:FMN-dependent NADH-azoreductase
MKLRQDLTQGGRYIEELFAADVLVIGAPMIRAEGVNISPEARQSAIENARRATGELSTLKLAA